MNLASSLRLQLGLSLLLCTAGPSLSAHAGPSTPSESLFTGCTAEPLGNEGWSYECSSFNAIISDHPGVSAESLWENSRRIFEGQAAGRMKFEEESATLAGRKARILRMSAKAPEDQEKSAFAVLSVEGRGGRRVLCKTTLEQQALCGRVLEKLAGNGWRAAPEAGATVKQPESALAGRELSAPAGCKLLAGDGDGRIECGDGSRLDWTHLPEASRLKRFVRDGVETFKDIGRVPYVESIIPCAIEGVRTECTHLRLLDPAGRRDVYFAGTEVRGLAIFISCISGGSSRELPQACQQVLSFR
ncbi:hypothetical protein JQX13_31530 [Archangium violaceum]|uniref:hypothetical protein n=1 Tax=Archangium violaceum TaxID=83451 RepID=UPI00193B70B5|nr:hypothetical protein [Archangium violaceum]QRK04743.1 hypothetical protein JQX13_31530 [Archangium violaceum]